MATQTFESYALQQAGKKADADVSLLREAIKSERLERQAASGTGAGSGATVTGTQNSSSAQKQKAK